MKQLLKMSAVSVMFGVSAFAEAGWDVAPASNLNYVSIKNHVVAENNSLSGLSGSLSDDGELRLEIDLTTVETGVPIRNERMQKLLFNVAEFATATVSAQLTPTDLQGLDAGTPLRRGVPITLTLHGVEKPLVAEVLAVKVGERLLVTSTAPVLVNARDFGLEAGVAALQQIAGLEAISRAVPVSIHLELTPAAR